MPARPRRGQEAKGRPSTTTNHGTATSPIASYTVACGLLPMVANAIWHGAKCNVACFSPPVPLSH